MNSNSNLIVMLTQHDKTVKNAYEIFKQCKNSNAQFWGFKQEPLPLEQMEELYNYMKECGKTTVLESITYTEEKSIKSVEIATRCKVDILMGTMFFDSVNELCKRYHIKYMPFVGKVSGCPSVLEGSIDSIIAEANEYIKKGVYGIDLLGYRYIGDAVSLNEQVVSQVNAPVCIAGSINSYKRLKEIGKINPWAFTIGGAFFENKFGRNFNEQVDQVCEYMKNTER